MYPGEDVLRHLSGHRQSQGHGWEGGVIKDNVLVFQGAGPMMTMIKQTVIDLYKALRKAMKDNAVEGKATTW